MCLNGLRPRFGMIVGFCAVSLAAWPAVHGKDAEGKKDAEVKLDVPYVPTNQGAVDAMLALAKVASSDYVFDLGCGDGRIVVTAAKKFKARGFGVDLDPQRIRDSNQNAAKAGVTDRVKFKVADIMVTDIRKASVVTLFLLDSFNLQLRPRLFAQLKPGVRVVSNSFHMADWKADKTVRHKDAYESNIHLWIIPAPVGGTWRVKTKTPGPGKAATLRLTQQFQAIAGLVSVAGGAEVPITEASLAGKLIKFTANSRIGDKDVKIAYEATVEGDTMKGTQKWLTGPTAGTYPWTAKRDGVNLTGRWHVEAAERAEDGGTLSVQRKDGILTASYLRKGKDQKEQALPAFYAWGTSVRFEVPPASAEAAVFVGTLEADAGSGDVRVGAAEAKTNWKAQRAAAATK